MDAIPVGAGFANLDVGLTAGPTSLPEWMVRGEVGWRPSLNTDVFAFADVHQQISQPVIAEAGLGLRVRF